MIKAVIFDMDGVLIDAKEWHYDALNRALELFGYTISRHDHLSSFDGLPTKEKLKMLERTHALPAALHGFIAEMKQLYTMELVYSNCKPTFQHEYALSQLKQRGYKLAVCSNSIAHTIEIMMQKAALAQYLEFFLSNEDVTHAKPNPEIYNKAISRLNLTPRECLIVEDNENGIKAAMASGANVLKVATTQDVSFERIMQAINKEQAC